MSWKISRKVVRLDAGKASQTAPSSSDLRLNKFYDVQFENFLSLRPSDFSRQCALVLGISKLPNVRSKHSSHCFNNDPPAVCETIDG